jgi:hypothetical protein
VGARANAAVAVLVAMSACSILDPLDGLSGNPGTGAGDAAGGGDAPSGQDSSSPSGDGTADSNGGDALPPVDAPSESSPANTSFMRSITVTASDAVPAGYTVSFSLDTASLVAADKLRADLDDLRVSDASGSDRNRVVDVVAGSPSVVWFQLESAIAGGQSATYVLRYGAPDAGAPPADGTQVFAFYDDFPGTQLSTHWVTEGAPAVSSGAVRLHAWNPASNPNPDSLRADYPGDGVPAASALEVVATVTNPSSGSDTVNGFWYWLGYQRQGDFEADQPWIIWVARSAGTVQAEEAPEDAGINAGPTITQDTAADDYRIERAPSKTVFYRNGVDSYEYGQPNTTPYSLMLRNWMPSSDVVISLVRAWLLVDAPPVVTLGPEQASP